MKHPLFQKIKSLVGEERKIQIAILECLEEIYAKNLHVEWGYGSLFAFATEALGYSDAAAQRRIETLKLIRLAPEVKTKLKTGALTLTSAAQIHSTLKQMKSPAACSALIAAAENKSTRDAEKALLETARKYEPDFAGEILINLRITQEAEEMMRQLRAHFSHQNLSDSEIIVKIGQLALKQKPAPTPAPEQSTNSRYIPAKTRRFIFQRDKTCTYIHKNRRCNSRYFLQIDHIHPIALGGNSNAQNLRLLYGAVEKVLVHGRI